MFPGCSSPGRTGDTIIQLGEKNKLDDRQEGDFFSFPPPCLICLASAQRFSEPLSEN